MSATGVVTHFQPQRCTVPVCPNLTWVFCAAEDGVCSFTGTQLVRYGAGTTFNTATASNVVNCTNAVFGDPVPGVAKHCDVREIPSCTPVDVADAHVTVGAQAQWGDPVASGTLVLQQAVQTITFTATAGRYVKLVALSEAQGADYPWTNAAEINVYNNDGLIPQSQMAVVSADSQEFQGDAGAAQHVIDGNTATIWVTAFVTGSPPHPHTLILDLGAQYSQVNKLTYLPRQSVQYVFGAIADYEVYVSDTLSTTWTDIEVTAGESYVYQIVAKGILDAVASASVPSDPICTYVRAAVRGRPDVLVE